MINSNTQSELEEHIANNIYGANWSNPDMTVSGLMKLPAPKFPVHVFSKEWCKWLSVSAEAKNCPVDFVGLSLITATAGLLGNARRANPWGTWNEPTIIWGALIGNPSSGKSPAIDTISTPIKEIEAILAKDYKETFKQYENDSERAKVALESWKHKLKKDLSLPKPVEAEAPPCPPRPRLLITDTSIEKAGELLSTNCKGLLMVRDELAGLIENFERRGGSDRQFYLESFGGRQINIDRKHTPEPIIVPSLAISVLGGMQPDKMNNLILRGDDDGFAARFLYAFPESIDFKKPSEVPDERIILEAFKDFSKLELLSSLGNGKEPKYIPFSKPAIDLYVDWRSQLKYREQEAEGFLISHLGKLPGLVVRLSCVLTYLDWVTEHRSIEPSQIDDATVFRAISLIDDYFYPMAKRAFGDAAFAQDQKDASTLAKWILKQRERRFNASELRRMENSPLRDTKRIKSALQILMEAAWISEVGGRESSKKGGRQRKDYEVNPLIFSNLN